MANSVSNDALWEKLSEIDRKIEGLSATQKSLIQEEEQAGIKSDIKEVKDEIVVEIREQVNKLGKHGDINFGANKENIEKILNIVARIRKQQREAVELQTENKSADGYFNLKFFKVKKTSFVITVLGLLVFLLTLFCMKQQNDYALLMEEFYKQTVIIQKKEK
jgi:hypothetical protein